MNANFLYVLARFNNTVLSDRYLIDVSPHFTARHIQMNNIIDARLIDKHTGYFIDITGMANMKHRASNTQLLLSDKHKHQTYYSDLHPLVRIDFQGISTWRPYNVEHCLTKEYGAKALRTTPYRGYNYDTVNAKWVGNGPLVEVPSRVHHTWNQGTMNGQVLARLNRFPYRRVRKIT
jgi:hypothetical protein